MMYESPIDIVLNDFRNMIIQQQENGVLKAVQKTGIIVDKEELLKALKYDREQYDKGYNDGYIDGKLSAINEIKEKLRSFGLQGD